VGKSFCAIAMEISALEKEKKRKSLLQSLLALDFPI
jgi:hypothetical protein